MEHSAPVSFSIALVEPRAEVQLQLAAALEAAAFQVRPFSHTEALLQAFAELMPDCVVLCAQGLEDLDWADLRRLRSTAPLTAIIVLAGRASIDLAVAAIKAGAHDFLEMPADADEVVACVREALRGRSRPAADKAEFGRLAQQANLTAREVQVLQQVVGGASNKRAGLALGISPRTVEVHRARIMEKLGARNTADLLRIVLSPKPMP